MIGMLTGRIVECAPDRVLLDVSGVGYTVHVPLSTFYALSNGGGPTVRLHVHTHVREDALQLFGFVEAEERELFETLIAISGVGPKLALSILSGIGAADLVVAVESNDRARLQKIPGVGKKTAERLLLELRDRLAPGAGRPSAGPGAVAGGPGASSRMDGPRGDAVSALVNLGYGEEVARRAVDAAVGGIEGEPALEDVLRAALTHIVG